MTDFKPTCTHFYVQSHAEENNTLDNTPPALPQEHHFLYRNILRRYEVEYYIWMLNSTEQLEERQLHKIEVNFIWAAMKLMKTDKYTNWANNKMRKSSCKHLRNQNVWPWSRGFDSMSPQTALHLCLLINIKTAQNLTSRLSEAFPSCSLLLQVFT